MANSLRTRGIVSNQLLRGHRGTIYCVSWAPDGRFFASAGSDGQVRIWDPVEQKLISIIYTHAYSLAWSPDGKIIATGNSGTGSISLHQTTTWQKIQEIRYDRLTSVVSMDWSNDSKYLAFSSSLSLGIWDQSARKLVIDRYDFQPSQISWSPDGKTLAMGLDAIRYWDGETKRLSPKQTKLDIGGAKINCLKWSPEGNHLAIGTDLRTVHIIDVNKNLQTNILEGHNSPVTNLSYSCDGSFLATQSFEEEGFIDIWRTDNWISVLRIKEAGVKKHYNLISFHPNRLFFAFARKNNADIEILELDKKAILNIESDSNAIHFINAKIVLLGESSVGKSGLGIRLAENTFYATESSHAARFWQIPVRPNKDIPVNVNTEITLWDFAGQPEYHLSHQLFLDDIDLALLLFDCSDANDPFRGVPYWAKSLKKHAPKKSLSFLVSSRCDVSPITVSDQELNKLLADYGLNKYFKTSAKTGEGITELWKNILSRIPWEKLTKTSTPLLFQIIRGILLTKKEEGVAYIYIPELLSLVQTQSKSTAVTLIEIETVIELLQTRGLVLRINTLPNLDLVLLQPELINKYASSIIHSARNHPQGIGSIAERDVLTGNFPITGFTRLPASEERIVTAATTELLIKHDLCFRDLGMLIFPSQISVSRPFLQETEHPPIEVSYEFSGSIETIYASLVVRLNLTNYFKRVEQWRYTVEFSIGNKHLGFLMKQVNEGTGQLDIYFDEDIEEFDRVTFIRFITDHLNAKGVDIKLHLRLYCTNCKREIDNRDALETHIQEGNDEIPCQYCNTIVDIPKSIEDQYRKNRTRYIEKQKKLSDIVIQQTDKEVQAIRDIHEYLVVEPKKTTLNLLHLSDLHFGTVNDANKWFAQLKIDLQNELNIDNIEYLVISGDIGTFSTKEEYEAASQFFENVITTFKLDSSRIICVPGNHDLNWDLSEDSYPYCPKSKLPKDVPDYKLVPAGDHGYLLRDDNNYSLRYDNFSDYFYKRFFNVPYPKSIIDQKIVLKYPENKVLFLGLNSCSEIDKYFPDNKHINIDALSNALIEISDNEYKDWLKIGVWHHPVSGPEMMDNQFLEMLQVLNFKLCMYGHIHEAQKGVETYDQNRCIYTIGAGTFGAITKQQVPSIPLQYNLLRINLEERKIIVESRRQEKPDGAWSADARWGDKKSPQPNYEIRY